MNVYVPADDLYKLEASLGVALKVNLLENLASIFCLHSSVLKCYDDSQSVILSHPVTKFSQNCKIAKICEFALKYEKPSNHSDNPVGS